MESASEFPWTLASPGYYASRRRVHIGKANVAFHLSSTGMRHTVKHVARKGCRRTVDSYDRGRKEERKSAVLE